jgi:PEP-CTERM motif
MKLATLAFAGALLGSTAQAAVVTVDFDGATNTDITNAYAGLTFNAPFPGSGPVRTWALSSAHTAGNVLGLSGQNNFYAFNQSNGAIDIVFDTAVSSVSIAAAFLVGTDQFIGIGGLPFMAVYNSSTISAATRIGLDSWDIAGDSCLTGNFCTSGWDTLAFNSSSNDIKAIRLTGSVASSGGVSRLALFDTLRYDTGNGGGGGGGDGNHVPEPGSAMLASLALLGLWGVRRRLPAQPR